MREVALCIARIILNPMSDRGTTQFGWGLDSTVAVRTDPRIDDCSLDPLTHLFQKGFLHKSLRKRRSKQQSSSLIQSSDFA
jgi:hypothetical protein